MLGKEELSFQPTYLKHHDIEQRSLTAGSQMRCFSIIWELDKNAVLIPEVCRETQEPVLLKAARVDLDAQPGLGSRAMETQRAGARELGLRSWVQSRLAMSFLWDSLRPLC